jgi:hypothetical protein
LNLIATKAAKFLSTVVTGIVGVAGRSKIGEENSMYVSGIGGGCKRVHSAVA